MSKPSRTAAARRRPRRALSAALAAAAASAALLLAAPRAEASEGDAQAAPGVGVNDTRRVIEQWVEARRTISREELDHALGMELLNERIALVERELESARTAIARTRESIAEADGRRAELDARNDELRRGTTTLQTAIVTLEARTRALLGRLPEPVRNTVAPLSQRIPEDPAESRLSLSQRFQNVLGVLNQVNKAQREIAVTSELRTLPDGGSAQVTALYLGLGAAWYVGANDTVAGTGGPGPDGWVWTPDNAAAAAIAEAIAIHKGETLARFVPLPLEIR